MNTFQFLNPESIAPFFTRVILGILFFMQGYDKIFTITIRREIETIRPSYHKLKFPDAIIYFLTYFTSYIEFICGLFLIVGLLKYVSLYLLGVDLIIVSFGMSLLNPVWNMELVFPRFILLLFLLIYPAEYDVIMLQNLLAHFR